MRNYKGYGWPTPGFGKHALTLLIIAASSALAAFEAVSRLAHTRPVSSLEAVAAAALAGFAGNELVARYRISAGRKIGSAALVADGLHARADGVTSLAVLLGVAGAALGWEWADPVVGLLITVAILGGLAARLPGDARGLPTALGTSIASGRAEGQSRYPVLGPATR